jgi:hypothetical protein
MAKRFVLVDPEEEAQGEFAGALIMLFLGLFFMIIVALCVLSPGVVITALIEPGEEMTLSTYWACTITSCLVLWLVLHLLTKSGLTVYGIVAICTTIFVVLLTLWIGENRFFDTAYFMYNGTADLVMGFFE